jgi:hypothetical protein
MAQTTIVLMTCDIHGDDTEATDTIVFGVGSERFEVDACEEHANEIRSTLSRYMTAGRKVRGIRSDSGNSRQSAPTTNRWGFTAADLSAEEKEFAVKQGWSGRGRISGAIMDKIAERRNKR